MAFSTCGQFESTNRQVFENDRISQCNPLLYNKKLPGYLISKIKPLPCICKHMFPCRDSVSASYSPSCMFFKRCGYSPVLSSLCHQRRYSLRIAWCGFQWSSSRPKNWKQMGYFCIEKSIRLHLRTSVICRTVDFLEK